MINKNAARPPRLLLRSRPALALRAALAGERGSDEPLAEHIRGLHGLNRGLWELEERVRSYELQPETVSRLKREIDRVNLARHAEVAAIDRHVDAEWPAQRSVDDPGATVNSESVGQMVDRLSVVRLKLMAFSGQPDRHADLERREDLLVRCLDRVVAALSRGDGVRQAFDEAKTYGAGASRVRTGR